MPRKALGKRDNDLGGLIGRLEGLQEELNPNKSQEPEEETDSFSKLRKLAARQVNEIRYVELSAILFLGQGIVSRRARS